MDAEDSKYKEQELRRIEKAKAKLEQQKKVQEEMEKALKVENRITEYKPTGKTIEKKIILR